MAKRQRFSKEFKLEAVRLLDLGKKSAAQLSLELGVRRNQLYKWKGQLSAKGRIGVRVDFFVITSLESGDRGNCPCL